MDIFEDRIQPLLESSGMTDRAVEDAIGLPRGIIYKWRTKKNKNFRFYIVDIAKFFNVSVEWLSGETDKKEKPTPENGSELTLDEIKASVKKLSFSEILDLQQELIEITRKRGES